MREIWKCYWDYTQFKSPYLQGFWHIFRHVIWTMPMAILVGFLLRFWIPLA